MRIVNIELGVDLSFEKGVEPKELLRRISTEAGAPGSIGLISLRSLLNGDLPDVNGYVVMTEEDEVEAAETAEAAASLAAEQVEVAAVAEEASAVEAEAAAPVVEGDNAAATDSEADSSEVVEETDAAPVVEEVSETGETAVSAKDAVKAAKDAVKAAFGINVNETLTPKASESSGVSRPRRDMAALITKAKAGAHGALLNAVETAGYTVVNVENTERWFGFNVPGGSDLRAAPRFDVSPLKNGSYSVSLYVNDRATKIKERLAPVDGKSVTPEMIIACMQSDVFKDKIAEGLAAIAKAE